MDNKIQLYFDFQIMLMQKYGGISRYFYDLYKGLPRDEFEVNVPILGNENEYFSQEFSTNTIYNKLPRGHWKLNEIYTKKIIEKAVSKNTNVLLHSTYFNPYILDWYKGFLVVTVYDMIYEKFPQYFHDATIVKNNKKKYIERADRIIAISESTKRDIIALYPEINEKKIEVVYLSSDQGVFEKKPSNEFIERFSKYEKYILFVGRRDKYKNFKNFALAAREILAQNSDLYLICVGGGEFNIDENNYFEYNGISSKVIQISARDEELGWLYKNAKCFVFPSLGEGFGIPILEAWQNKCPVTLSDIPCFKEIGADASRYFNPCSVESIIDCISETINTDNGELIEKGTERLKMFGKEKTIMQHIEIYKSLLNDI